MPHCVPLASLPLLAPASFLVPLAGEFHPRGDYSLSVARATTFPEPFSIALQPNLTHP